MLVEDCAADAELARYAIQVAQAELALEVVTDGLAALERLRSPGPAGLPDLVMMDLGLPRLDGLGLLQAIRSDPALTHLPVVILTGSTDPRVVRQCYQLLANAFVPKPLDFDAFIETVRALVTFWRDTARLPRPLD